MDYKCRGNWYTAVAKSSQVKQSVNAVRVWLNMLERCRPPCPTPSLHRSQKSWGISQRSLNQNLNTRHLVNTLGETEIGSRSADISTVMDIHGIHVSPLPLCLCLFLLFTTKCYVHLATPSAYLITLLGIAIGADLQLFHIFDSTRPSSGCIDTFSAIFTVCFGFCFITNWVWP